MYNLRLVDVLDSNFYKYISKGNNFKTFTTDIKHILTKKKKPKAENEFKRIKSNVQEIAKFGPIKSVDDVDSITAFIESDSAWDKFLRNSGCKTWKDAKKSNENYLQAIFAIRELDKILASFE